MNLGPAEPSRDVVVIGGDPIVGRTLELLLDCDRRNVRFRSAERFDDLVLEGAHLIIFTPRLHPKHRERIFARIEILPHSERVPVLELVAGTQMPEAKHGHFLVSWPCRTTEFVRHFETALSFRSNLREVV